jgi:hypothetical protein
VLDKDGEDLIHAAFTKFDGRPNRDTSTVRRRTIIAVVVVFEKNKEENCVLHGRHIFSNERRSTFKWKNEKKYQVSQSNAYGWNNTVTTG